MDACQSLEFLLDGIHDLRIPVHGPDDLDIAAASIVARLPAGLDTEAGKRGVRLSGVERQRLRLASALLRKPELLILDEALSALSPVGEGEIITNLRKLAPLTIVVIAHRASSLMWTDHLLVVDEGRIADTGSPSELAKRNNALLYAV
jgi:ABC-type multidrug transport system fused ATPase/permease subunit